MCMLRTLTDFHARIEWRTAQAKLGWLYAGITTTAVTDSIYSHHQVKLGAAKHQAVLWQCALPFTCLG